MRAEPNCEAEAPRRAPSGGKRKRRQGGQPLLYDAVTIFIRPLVHPGLIRDYAGGPVGIDTACANLDSPRNIAARMGDHADQSH